jgi:hypothetical protein
MICGVVAGEFRSYGELLEGRVAPPRVGAVVAGELASLPWLLVVHYQQFLDRRREQRTRGIPRTHLS